MSSLPEDVVSSPSNLVEDREGSASSRSEDADWASSPEEELHPVHPGHGGLGQEDPNRCMRLVRREAAAALRPGGHRLVHTNWVKGNPPYKRAYGDD